MVLGLRSIIFGTLLVAASFFIFGIAQAQESAGIGLTPSLIEEGADPGQVLEKVITVRNLSSEEQYYYLYTRDIEGVRNGGAPIYAAEGAEKTGYEITEWITLGITEMTLAPGEEAKVPVTIAVPESATPGSHFGAIFVSKEPPRLRNSGAGVGYQVANIVSIRITGEAIESAQIRSLSTDKLVYGDTNVNFLARVENKGNVLVRPYGPLEIYNMFGSRVVAVDFNENLNGVFPATVRDFNLVWTDENFAFGRYEAVLSLVYGEQGRALSTMTASVSFWVLPMQIIKPALIILGGLLLVSYIGIRLYVRSTVSRLSGGRRLVQRGSRGPSSFLLVAIVMLGVTAVFLILLLALFA